jgi:hypothetical protein
MVWLSGKNILKKHVSKKLDHRLYRAYPVVERIDTQAYRLELSQRVGSIEEVFHVLLLELYRSDGRTAPKLSSSIGIDSGEV